MQDQGEREQREIEAEGFRQRALIGAGKDGRAIASRVDPETSNDVCTFCVHATMGDDIFDAPKCALGFDSYFRSISQYGAIWVSDCERGELRPEFAAAEKKR